MFYKYEKLSQGYKTAMKIGAYWLNGVKTIR